MRFLVLFSGLIVVFAVGLLVLINSRRARPVLFRLFVRLNINPARGDGYVVGAVLGLAGVAVAQASAETIDSWFRAREDAELVAAFDRSVQWSMAARTQNDAILGANGKPVSISSDGETLRVNGQPLQEAQ